MSNPEPMETKITHPTKWRPSFVSVVFVLIAVYFVVQGILLIRHHSIKAYNIETPTSDSLTVESTGIILREEKTYTVPKDGFVTFFTIDGEWVAKDQMIASVDQNGMIQEKLRSLYYGHSTLSYATRLRVQNAIRKAVESYDPMDFDTALVAKGNIESTVMNALMTDGGEELRIRLSGLSYTAVNAPESGFFLDWYDGYEGKTPESLRESDFEATGRTGAKDAGDEKKEGDFLYKLATDNKFRLVFLMTESQIVSLSSKRSLSVRMEDGNTITGTFSVSETADGKPIGILTFAKYGANYLSDRFVSFRVVDTTATGFKIPESSIVEKQFYVVPKAFITEGAGNEQGLMVSENGKMTFIAATTYLYSQTGDNFVIGEDSAYVYSDELKPGMTIVSQGDERKTETLSHMASVEGCFQINNGYCIFKPIVRIRNSIDTSFVMISSNVRNGLKSYDRIVLNGEGLTEQEIIFE